MILGDDVENPAIFILTSVILSDSERSLCEAHAAQWDAWTSAKTL